MADRSSILSALDRNRWMLEPAVALVLLAFLLLTGLSGAVTAVFAMVFYAAAVALSRVLPGVSFALAWLGVLIELVEPQSLPGAFRLVTAFAIVVTLFGIVSHGGRALRWLGFASAILWGPAMAFQFTVHGEISFPLFGPVVAGYYASQGVGLLLMSLLLTVVFTLVWLLGFLVSRQRGSDRGSSVLMWLASSGGTPLTEDDPNRTGLVRRLDRRQLTIDILGALLFACVCLLFDFGFGYFSSAPNGRGAVVVLIPFSLAVALRRMAPAFALALAWLAAVVQLMVGLDILVSDTAVLIVLYATAAFGDRVVRYAGLISAGVGALVAALYLSITAALSPEFFESFSSALTGLTLRFAVLLIVSATVLGLSWVLGLLMRTWREARWSRRARVVAERDRNRAEEDVVVEQERTRIARDMHDVVAHSLAVVIAQADGARYARQTAPEAVDTALTTIAATARSALADVRVLLAELRHAQPEGPQPTLADLDRTIEQIRAAGLAVDFDRIGELDGFGSAQQIAAYRIVQEALTNALRHGDTSRPATVVLAEASSADGGPGLVITVRNSMRTAIHEPSTTGSLPRIGHGLPGMRERASLAGGTFAAGPASGAFVVSAFLPLGGR